MTGDGTGGRFVVARMERALSSVEATESGGEDMTVLVEAQEATVDWGVVGDGKVAVQVREEFLGGRAVEPLEDRIMITEGSDGGKGCREAECEELGGFPAARPLTRDPEQLLPRGKGEGELTLCEEVGRSGEDDAEVWGCSKGRVVCGKITSGSVERGMSTGIGLGQIGLGLSLFGGETNVISGGGTSSVKTMEDDMVD